MRNIASLLLLISVLFAGCESPTSQIDSPRDLTVPRQLALTWLTLVDNERYSDAYDQYNEGAKRRVPSKEHSIAFYRSYRQPHGYPVGRSISREFYAVKLPMMPDSEYAVFDFSTDFPSEKGVFEQVLTEYRNGQWEIAGYACHK